MILLLDIVNNNEMNIVVEAFLWYDYLFSFGYTSRDIYSKVEQLDYMEYLFLNWGKTSNTNINCNPQSCRTFKVEYSPIASVYIVSCGRTELESN